MFDTNFQILRCRVPSIWTQRFFEERVGRLVTSSNHFEMDNG
jgi:hypothetical protein